MDIAIVGLSGRFPGAGNVEEFWDNLRGGVESIRFFADAELLAAGVDPELLRDPHYVKAAPVLAGVDRFDARLFGYAPREASLLDPQHRVFLECAREALEDAGYDPAKFAGRIGVYAGGSISTYLLFGGLLPELYRDYLPTVLANDKDFLPTRVSYKLDLTGPSVAVQTACSTALVAVHLAGQGLLAGECDLALAGGVSVRVPQVAGYRYQEGGVLSPDGHCRAFDAGARGTVFGSGAGIVVLKRLVDARADGDRVLAVVKGSAVNNDGATKADFAAPSVTGQSRAIAEALSRAGTDAASLSYVEAHGTGTALGDPIEVAALTAAFRAFTRGRGFCAIGSVKTNIGHTDAAAGAVSLIKTVLALRHRLLPPTLHYRSPNPALDLDRSPFHVTSELTGWSGAGGPRRAGVNCLGMGGTNAFLVLEEAPAPAASGPAPPYQLIQLSARTPTALETATARLAAHLARHPGTDLADVAYTLRVGRADLAQRRVAVCRDTADAVRLLRRPPDPAGAAGPFRDAVFLFPGQGSQYPGMGDGLYRTEPVFREHLDRCRDLLPSVDLREIVRDGGRLDRTEYTQPALFAVEYALAQLWISWGVLPVAAIGHSLGEYVAACLSGVFSLEDALDLVALRGRLMQELPPGAMLAVPLSEEAVRHHLGPDLSLAAVNGPADVVVAGTPAAVRACADRLAGAGVRTHLLRVTRAFHSAAVEPAAACLARRVRELPSAAPRIPFISNVTGDWIGDAAPDPGYWARQMRQPVRFAAGIGRLLADTGGVLLEVGPGRTLSTLARRYTRRPALACLPDGREPGDERAFLLRTVGRLWLAGIAVDAGALHAGQRRHRIALPTYPFERERYWVDRAGPVETPGEPVIEAVSPEPEEVGAGGQPGTAVQGAVAAVWRSVLRVERIGVDDDFFALGGSSLLIPQVLTRLNAVFEVDLPALTLLESPTVAGLAERIETVYRLAQR
ncbi:MAG TPA: beta-ketoacyl synthase N-terminal-like domain-containing protein [Rugosimonospora sp.]|nr:beta-ketoacyl synthase N-terminal-like domain-containing protein [Rugosimonospora sp.]